MAEKWDETGLDISNDPNYNILGAYHKLYASCRHTHAPIDGALEIMSENHLETKDIEKIVVRTYKQGVKGHDFKDIPTVVSGKMSIPFCVGLAFVTGAAGMHEFNERSISDPEIMRLTKCTEVIADDELTNLVPAKRAASVEVFLKDGTSFFKQVDFAKGEPEIPMSTNDFRAKFLDLACYGGKSETEANRIIEIILTTNCRISELMTHLR